MKTSLLGSSPVAYRWSIRLLKENLKSHNSFLWRQLTASGPSPNIHFLSPQCPQPLPSYAGHHVMPYIAQNQSKYPVGSLARRIIWAYLPFPITPFAFALAFFQGNFRVTSV